ncbi:MAG: hypothetical protein ACE5IL_03395 [Myxococcota bacterium]
MPDGPHDRSRALGGIVCVGAVLAGALFVYGVLEQIWWALAVPVAAGVLFVLGLVFWIGWTILTVRVEAEGDPLDGTPSAPSAATTEAPELPDPARPRD